jgi:hypothetical protein
MSPYSSAGNNSGNFRNRSPEDVAAAAGKGGTESHKGGFASMDPDRQVYFGLRD